MRRFLLALLPVALVIAPLSGCGNDSIQSTVPTGGSHPQTPSGAARHASDKTLPYIGGTTGNGGYDGVCTASMSECPVFVTYDPGPGYPGGDNGPGVVAITGGVPSGSCAQMDGSPSLPVGTTLGEATNLATGQTTTRSVIDVNTVNSLAFIDTSSGAAVGINYQPVGWIYLDNNGSLWFQYDAAASWSMGISWNLNKYFGISLTTPPGKNATFMGPPPKTTPINNHLQTTACWQHGRALVPGTVSAALAANA